jgi:hypothetical protein
MGASPGDVLIALSGTFEPVSAVRSTLLISSLATLTEHGYDAPYFAALPPKLHPAIRNAIAGSWIPLDVAVAHYTACVAIGLPHEAIVRIGRSVGDKVQGTLLGTAVRMAKEVGVTPLTVIPQFPRFWARAFQGGAICGFKIGPKEVRLEAHKTALLDQPYFRSSLIGLVTGVLEPFCTRVYMTERPGARPTSSAAFRVQWV